jgi:AcrR family transcriptional regulator
MLQNDREPTLRELNIEARRQRILEAARHLIIRGGMSSLSMRKLAAEAGLAVRTLYNLYGSRDEILFAISQDAIDRMVPILDAEAPIEDPLARCRGVITVSVRYFAEHEAIYRPMIVASYEGLSQGPEADRRLAQRAAGMQRDAIAQAIERGLLADTLEPMRLGEQIYHGYEFACVQWAFGTIDAAGFEARALYGMYLVLLAVAEDVVRPRLEAELRALEPQLADSAEYIERRQRHPA